VTWMAELSAEDVVVRVKAAHERERSLIDCLTEEQVRAASALPGWTRGHVLVARRAFMRAASRQIEYALADGLIEFYDGGRAGRDGEIEANAGRPAGELVSEVQQALTALDEGWSRVGRSDWARPVTYRGGGALKDVLQASWREAEIHCVDLDLGTRPSVWSAEFCVHVFEFLAPRAPEGVQIELTTPGGDTWTLGGGERIQVRGALTDLAAWLAGRKPVGPVESSTGTLPELRRLRDARRAR
jgi:maleylpyruvate isomerase